MGYNYVFNAGNVESALLLRQEVLVSSSISALDASINYG